MLLLLLLLLLSLFLLLVLMLGLLSSLKLWPNKMGFGKQVIFVVVVDEDHDVVVVFAAAFDVRALVLF